MITWRKRGTRALTQTVAVSLALGALALVGASPASAATTLNVSTTADIAANAGACGNPGITVVPSTLSLREAACLANNIGGTSTINVPSGTYTLSNGELRFGVQSGQDVTLKGAGSGSTIIDAAGSSRVLNFDPNIVGGVTGTVTGLTIKGGADSEFGGAGIIGGSGYEAASDELTISNSVISGNVANATSPDVTNSPGGGVQFVGGTLTITGSTISGNSSYSSPGAGVAYSATGASSDESLEVSGSTFSGNKMTNSNGLGIANGGALDTRGVASTPMTVNDSRFVANSVVATSGDAVGAAIRHEGGALAISRSTFTGNEVSGGAATGGAIEIAGGTAVMRYNRIAGNTAASGSAIHIGSDAGTVDAAKNWVGCNTGAVGDGCDTVISAGTAPTLTPRLVLTATASPSTVDGPSGLSTVTGSLLTDSAGDDVQPAQLTAFNGLPVTMSAPLPTPATIGGSTSSVAPTMADGKAVATYDSQSSGGVGSVSVGLDSTTVKAPITVRRALAVGTNPADLSVKAGETATFTAAASGYPTPTVQWQRSTNGGSSFTNIAGATSTTLSFTAAAGDNGNRYRAVFSNGNGSVTSEIATLSVGQSPAFTSADSVTFVRGVARSVTITTSGVPDVSSITKDGDLPTGLDFTDNEDGTATLSGTPSGAAGNYPVTLTATNGVNPDATQTLNVQVNQTPSVSENPQNQTVAPGASVTFTAAATGTPTPTVQWQRSTDAGAQFTNIAGATQASYTFNAVVGDNGSVYRAVFTNAAGSDTTTGATLRVGAAPAFTSANTTDFEVGEAGTFTVTAGGVPSAAISSASAFPAWLTLTDEGDGTASLAGTPPAGSGGTYTLTLEAANSFGTATKQTFTLRVLESPTFTSDDEVTFVQGTAGSFSVTTKPGFPAATTLTSSGDLPTGVTFADNGDGTASISGTPAAGTAGVYPITLKATATGGSTPARAQTFTLTVHGPPTITSSARATFTAGERGTFTVTTSAGRPTATTLVADGDLPAGVTFVDSGDGTAVLSGTPASGTGGTYSIVITAANGVSPAPEQSFTLTIAEAPAFTSADSTTLSVGEAGTFTVTTSGHPVSELTSAGALPDGVTFTDNGDGTATLAGTPAAGADGTYPLKLTAGNDVDNTVQTFTLTVEKLAQAITITSTPPAAPVVGGSYVPTGVADSGGAVTFSIDPATTGSACSLTGTSVTFDAAGTCVIAANQAGDDTYLPAPQVVQAITVAKIATSVGVATSISPTVFGQASHATATVEATGGAVEGTVQFTVDGADLGGPVAVSAGTARSIDLAAAGGDPLAPGAHTVDAVFTPTDTVTYSGASGSATQIVNQAATSTTLAVGGSSITATVAAVAPGAGTPTGSVEFSVSGAVVGTASLVDGVATLQHSVSSGLVQQVAAVYAGDSSFAGSSTSTSRNDPTISATITSAQAKSKYGWYRGPVTVTYTCTTNGAALTEPCPAPVRLTTRGAGSSVTRTITAIDGGAATAVVGGINIDDQRPSIKVKGVKNGRIYTGSAPKATCVAKDSLSGVASCKVTKRKRGSTTTYRVTATDKAGNTRSTTGRYRTVTVGLQGASFTKGAFNVRRGQTYTVIVYSGSKPTYYNAEVAPRTPRKPGKAMRPAGRGRYALGVTMTDLRGAKYWNLGVKIGKKMHIVRIRARG